MEKVNTFTRQLSVNYRANIKHISGKIRNQVYTFRVLNGRLESIL